VTCGKLDPAIFRLASEQLRVPPPETLVFEDSVSGVKAAKAAGMKCVGIAADGLIPKLLDAGAIQIVPNYTNLSLNHLQTLLSIDIWNRLLSVSCNDSFISPFQCLSA